LRLGRDGNTENENGDRDSLEDGFDHSHERLPFRLEIS
jgi:hypothetical protein